jgi:xylulokinase
MKYVLGIDLGTSSMKGLLADKDGKIIEQASYEYPVINPQPGFSEQDPAVWFKAVKDVMAQIISKAPDAKNSIEGISFSGQMHSLVLLDKDDKPLRNAILWNDVRTKKQCGEITEKLQDKLLSITKNRALEGFTLPKILWVAQNEPAIWQKARAFLLPKDYLGFCLTGNKQMEFSDAAGTLMLDIEKKEWSKEIMQAFNLPAEIFPRLVNSDYKIGFLKDDIAKEIGIENKVAVFAGAADNAAAAIGAGILQDDIGLASIGTSGVFLSYEGQTIKNYHGHLHFFNHAIKDSFYSMGVTLCAGNSLGWFKDMFLPNLSFDEIVKQVSKITSNDDLFFTPYLVGERTPVADSKIRGSFVGIDISHTPFNFAKAVMEGITFSLKDCMELMIKYADKKFKKIISVGGGAKSPFWLQMQADIFNTEILTLSNEQGPAMGAVMIAAVGLGWYENFKKCGEAMIGFSKEFKPNPDKANAYKRKYEIYKKIYPMTAKILE